MDERIVVGEIIKAQGLKGELKVKPFTDDITRFKKLKAVEIDSVIFRVENLRIAGDFVYLKLAGVDDKNRADGLKNKLISIDRIHAAPLDHGAFYISDIQGCALFVDSEQVGEISYVYRHGAADVFEVTLKNGKTMMFPFLEKLNLDIDVAAKIIRADKQALDTVAVYHD